MSMICYKGKVLTVDSNDTVAGYLVEDKGRIVYVSWPAMDFHYLYRNG